MIAIFTILKDSGSIFTILKDSGPLKLFLRNLAKPLDFYENRIYNTIVHIVIVRKLSWRSAPCMKI